MHANGWKTRKEHLEWGNTGPEKLSYIFTYKWASAIMYRMTMLRSTDPRWSRSCLIFGWGATLSADDCIGREGHLSLGVRQLVYCSRSGRWPRTHAHGEVITKLSGWVETKREHESWRGIQEKREGEVGMDTIKVYYLREWNCQRINTKFFLKGILMWKRAGCYQSLKSCKLK